MTTLTSSAKRGDTPRYSIVAAVYNVARYLDEFTGSLDSQSIDRSSFEVVAVDDGSTDDGLAKLEQWAARSHGRVRVVTKENGGQSTARNLGLRYARGEWVTFADADDVLDRDYLLEVDRFLAANPETTMVGTYRMILDDATGEVSDTHPLRKHFAGRNSLRHLDGWPSHFHGSAPAAFFRRARVEEINLRFDPQVRPNFEDGHFCVRYLLAAQDPAIGFVKTAVYRYRKRSDASSTLQRSLADPDRYTKVLRYGYLAVLRQSLVDRDHPPEWLQNYVIYELSWYFTSQDVPGGAGGSAPSEVAEEFHALMSDICRLLEPRVVQSFRLRRLRPAVTLILLHAYRADPWHQDSAVIDRVDGDQSLARVRYHFTGSLPVETVRIGGVVVEPAFAKIRTIKYHDRVLLRERIVWVPTRSTIRVTVGGTPLRLLTDPDPSPHYGISATELRNAFSTDPAREAQPTSGRALSGRDRLILRIAGSRAVRRRFEGAWVLMDRIHDADDSGEVLFRYLRTSRPKVNAWFVIQRGTSDYRRLKEEGFRRVVPHGSLLWKLLMINCAQLISSHADTAVVRPAELSRFGRSQWRFTFLQHGVIKDDLSNWLNRKRIDLFVASTPQEYESLCGDETPYEFTAKEVQLTGLPRFDKLIEIAQRVRAADRDLILVAPTWRHWLVPRLASGSQRRSIRTDFFSSEFAVQWLGLLRSAALADLCRDQGLRIGFLPHPNLQAAVPDLDLPSHVEALSYDAPDVQQLFARAAVTVTDYSSIAFNAAYIERPVVYFQFDADRVLGGGHMGKQGYFSYERDGFGPVATTLDAAEAAIAETVRASRAPAPTYQQRIDATFPERDGHCCKRVTDAILASEKRWRPTSRE